ncbi:CRISPR-associated endonuclease Cas2 [Methylorubrum podarium]|uniref:CRISPR-associated endonuclease Cas2 n=1 Tax=Methylorubrum podarium TaxID=200476 RepID=UPI001EE2E736|nr:CRISPR-associated endonuclease Cas2 [Methylorubrum podarium]
MSASSVLILAAMSRTTFLFVFAYDVARDRARSRLHDMLAETLVRVQDSVFEGRLTPREADRLFERAAALIGPDDTLRLWAVGADGLARCRACGGPPVPEARAFHLF